MINKFQGKTRWLSNFWMQSVVFEGAVYPTNENAYQAAKLKDKTKRVIFYNISPHEAKKLGMKVSLREGWDNIKYDVMYKINKHKFSSGSYLANKLVDTGNMQLVEGNSWGDTYWGVCHGIGENNLGKILMTIRSELKDK